MGTQTQTTTVSDIYGVGVANLHFNDSYLGATKGDTTINIVETDYDQTIDKYGNTPIAVYNIGINITVTAQLKEETIAKLLRLMQTATDATTKLTFGKQVGTAKTGYRLIVLPYDDNAHDVIVYKAVPRVEWNLAYNNGVERVYPVIFRGLIDESRSDGDMLFRIDESYSI